MKETLPIGEFRRVDISLANVLLTDDNVDYGYLVEVDLIFPRYLHAEHNDYPLAPDRMKITPDILSSFQRRLIEEYGFKPFTSVSKLAQTLLNKTHYICHYRLLKFYADYGLLVSRVHRVLQFR